MATLHVRLVSLLKAHVGYMFYVVLNYQPIVPTCALNVELVHKILASALLSIVEIIAKQVMG